MKIYPFKPKLFKTYNDEGKQMKGWGYWGDASEIKMAISKGRIDSEEYAGEKPHAHLESYVYFIILAGSGIISVEGKDVTVQQDEVLEIAPGEKYQVKGAITKPFEWLVVGTVTGNKDKVVY